MNRRTEEQGIHFGHEFHGREHHFLVTRAALEFLDGGRHLDESGLVDAYNHHLARIHTIAEKLSRASNPLTRIVLDRSAFE